MSKNISKDDVIAHKKNAIRKVNNLLESYINSEESESLKKADLISYWLESFTSYVSFEERFDPSRLLNYKRGDVIRVNFGFNVGKELGGLHFAVVIDNETKRNAHVLTVVPLSSTDGRDIHSRNVDLGTELFTKVSDVQKKLIDDAQERLKLIVQNANALTTAVDLLKDVETTEQNSSELDAKLQDVIERTKQLYEEKDLVENQIQRMERNEKEIQKMKAGSMAVINQITTISKQRIYTPKRSEDFLYNISLSPTAMDKINEKIKEQYIFG